MNKELVFKKEMRAFDINVDDIKPDEHIFGAIEEAIIKMRNECLIDRLEVVLNNNLIDIKDKITDNRTILGCRLSYADLSKDVSFIVRQDNEPTYEQLQQENQNLEKQLEYLRSGEYYNQLRFENEMLQQVVDTNGVPSEVYDYIDCTHRNTELLEENQKYKEVINKIKELIIDNIEETTYEYIGSNKIKVLQNLIMDNDGVNELLDILKEVE